MSNTTAILGLYRLLTGALSPLAPLWLGARARRGKEDRARLSERLGWASEKRPHGALLWLHGASVGEAKVILLLVEALGKLRPDLHFLVTSGTLTSAQVLGSDLPPTARHQFAPLDTPAATARFITHWQPDLGVFAESELWPNLIAEAQQNRVRLALVNARMNDASLRHWHRFPASARALLDAFAFIGAANRPTRDGLAALTSRPPVLCGNLKRAAPAPWVNETRLADLAGRIGKRPVWLGASTHEGEEPIVLAAHLSVRESAPQALLILAPRHPERGREIAALCHSAGLSTLRRAAGQEPDGKAAVYVADTLREMGLWMRLADMVFMGGSLRPGLHGHNPIEAAKLHAPLICGPYHDSFAGPYADLEKADALIGAGDAPALAAAVLDLWAHPQKRRDMAAKGMQMAVRGGSDAVRKTIAGLLPLLPEVR